MTKALFLDIDGTLVSFATHQIPASTIQALEEAKQRGHLVFIATGRPRILINNLAPLQQRSLIDGYVTMNGGYCYAGTKVVYKRPVPQPDVQTLVDYCGRQGVPCILVGEDDIAVYRPDERIRKVFGEYLSVTVPIPTVGIEAAARTDIYQLTPFVDKQQEAEVMPLLPGSEAGRWHPAFADITARGNNKQRGIDEMARHFGLALSDTVAIGDGGNDISMLKHAGTGIAMGNASPEVKAAADYVTTTVDDGGIAQALRHFGII